MDIPQYLARVRYRGEVSPTLEMLRSLQEAHLCSVPFENLDIHLGRRIILDPVPLFGKIVLGTRGGFCYELNGLFHRLLRELGFGVKLAMGRVYDRVQGTYGQEFDHMLILADVEGGTWLVDVGFGDFSMHPLKLVLNTPLHDRNGTFLIDRYDDTYARVSRLSLKENRYLPEYLFSEKERSLGDFTGMCDYHQTSPESHFTQKRVCSIATATGRKTLTEDRLIVTERGVRTETVISDESAYRRALQNHFGVVL